MNRPYLHTLLMLALALAMVGCPPQTDAEAPDGGAEPAAEPAAAAAVSPAAEGEVEPQSPPVEPYAGDDAAYLTVNAKPWSIVYLDGGLLKNTPMREHPIPPGEHTLEIHCGACEPGQTKTFQFSVPAGETYVSVRNSFDH